MVLFYFLYNLLPLLENKLKSSNLAKCIVLDLLDLYIETPNPIVQLNAGEAEELSIIVLIWPEFSCRYLFWSL